MTAARQGNDPNNDSSVVGKCNSNPPHNGNGYGNSSARSRSGSLAVAAIIAAAFATRIALMFGSDDGGVSSGSKPC